MNRKLLVSIVGSLSIISCNYSSTRTNESEKTVVIQNGSTCYLFATSKDSVYIKVNANNNIVDGELSYNYFEKDKNAGTFKGQMNGDTLYLNYQFMSEGTQSEREVAFIKTKDGLVEGYGEMDSETGTKFKDKSQIKFTNTNLLSIVKCKE